MIMAYREVVKINPLNSRADFLRKVLQEVSLEVRLVIVGAGGISSPFLDVVT